MTVCSLLPASTRAASADRPTTAPPAASLNSLRREKRRGGGVTGGGGGGVGGGSGASMRPRKMPDSGDEGKTDLANPEYKRRGGLFVARAALRSHSRSRCAGAPPRR